MDFYVFRCYVKVCSMVNVKPSFKGLARFNNAYGRMCRDHGNGRSKMG